MSLARISRKLSRAVSALPARDFAAYVYNPLDYARRPHERYLETWGSGPKEVLLLGMNPGPFGMAQTGVPFGDVVMVRDFLRIEAPVKRPAAEHPKRPIEGFACERREVSGSRLWGWAEETFGTPDAFFSRFFVVNYCPLVFMAESGKNLTPDKLPQDLTVPLEQACDAALRETIESLKPSWVIGVGAYALKQAQRAVSELRSPPPRLGTILHPSPASPAANRGWAPQATAQLEAMGLLERKGESRSPAAPRTA